MKRLVILSILFFTSSIVFSWGENGHRIVAEICEAHLSPQAKAELVEILGKNYLAEIATWPDYIKSEDAWKFADSWHYTTVHMDQTVEQVRMQYGADKEINDALEAIALMTDILQDKAEAIQWFEKLMKAKNAKPFHNSTKATALAFLVHLVGDIHQPMHVGTNKDRGGNSISVLFFDERTNLHAVWDSRIIEHERLSYTEFARFIDKLSAEKITECQNSTVDDWANESIMLREDIYNTIYDYTDRDTGLPSFSWRYQHDYIVHVKDRLVKSGVRLAGLLNGLYA
jgi:hypothetical protein